MLNVTLAQINPVVGDIEGNLEKIKRSVIESQGNSHLIAFPELAASGYSPEDLLLKPNFVKECMEGIKKLAEEIKDVDAIVVLGTPHYEGDLFNSLYLIHRGKILGVYHKGRLPNYSVFDEKRYFREGEDPLLVEINGIRVGFSICEDIWYPDHLERYAVLSGAEVVVNINASPYHIGKQRFRESFVRARAEDNLCYVVYVNLVGGNDELVFDGRSMVIDPLGEVVGRAKAFEEDLLSITIDESKVRRRRLLDLRWRNASKEVDPFPVCASVNLPDKPLLEARVENSPEGEEEIYEAIVLGTRDYVTKNGFDKAVIGLSGGIDSSLTACVAVDALGKDKVLGVFLPTRFSSEESFQDARDLAEKLGIEFHVIPIDGIYATYEQDLSHFFGEIEFNTADENLQARIRANILFYISNKMGHVVLSTSNKSESAVGYTTIYGDMSGGFAPLKDVYKTLVYKLAEYRNSVSKVIPDRVFKKPPSAELRPDQKDQDTLPPYDTLDGILVRYIEENMSPEEIVRDGFDESVVKRVITMIRSSEYKRKQAPVGVKITPRAFGKDWRMPIVNKFNA